MDRYAMLMQQQTRLAHKITLTTKEAYDTLEHVEGMKLYKRHEQVKTKLFLTLTTKHYSRQACKMEQ